MVTRAGEVPENCKNAAVKLAAAIWMAEYEATEKSFYRLKKGLREIRIAKAYDIIQAMKALNMEIMENSK
jgi:hypothetical protein